MTLDFRTLLGLTPYGKAHRMQLEAVEKRKNGTISDTVFLLEHPPVITLGKNASGNGILASGKRLSSLGIELYRTERGGEATYHCPGQLVAYPIIDLHMARLGASEYIQRLEEVIIRALDKFNIKGTRIRGKTGIFNMEKGPGKIGAIGVRITKGVSFHGLCINVNPDLSGYRLIVPCGLADIEAVSMASLCGEAPSMERFKEAVKEAFLTVFQNNFQ